MTPTPESPAAVEADVAVAASTPPLRTRVGAIVAKIGRVVLVVCVVGVCWWTLQELTGALRDPAQPIDQAPTAAEQLAEPTGLESLSALMVGGRWEFSDGAAALSFGDVPTAEIDAYWSRPARRRTPEGPLDGADQAWERSLLDLLKSLQVEPTVAGATKTYAAVGAEFRAEALAETVDGTERLVAARAAMQGDDGRWRTLELEPQPKSAAGVDRLELIPYPPGSERLATRSDLMSGVVAEFARVPLPLPKLLEHARAAGSQIIFPDLGLEAGTREGFCVYNGRTIRVVLWQPPGTQATTILAMALGEPTAAAKLKPINVP
jgi:hypothetical protein